MTRRTASSCWVRCACCGCEGAQMAATWLAAEEAEAHREQALGVSLGLFGGRSCFCLGIVPGPLRTLLSRSGGDAQATNLSAKWRRQGGDPQGRHQLGGAGAPLWLLKRHPCQGAALSVDPAGLTFGAEQTLCHVAPALAFVARACPKLPALCENAAVPARRVLLFTVPPLVCVASTTIGSRCLHSAAKVQRSEGH